MMKHFVHCGKAILFYWTLEIFIFSYASRTKNIRNTPIINEDSSNLLLQQYAEEIQRLRAIINSSNKHPHSLSSRSRVVSDVKLDDQQSIKTACDRQISSQSSSFTKSTSFKKGFPRQ